MWGFGFVGWRRFLGGLISAGLVTVACVTIEDEPSVVGLAGETCRSRNDCAKGLVCIDRVCGKPGAGDDGGADAGAADAALDGADGGSETGADAQLDSGDAGDGGDAEAGTDAGDAQPDAVPPRLGLHGWTCDDTRPCEPQFTCAHGKCSGSENGLTPTDRSCELIECTEPADCCDVPEGCPTLLEQCNATGNAYYCDAYNAQCLCDPADWECNNEICKFAATCTVPGDCKAPLKCAGGTCVECEDSDECSFGYGCISGECVFQCTIDEQCDNFHECRSGDCVRVGCAADSECRALFSNDPNAACIDSTCRSSCVRDTDCNGWNQRTNVCFEGYCHPVGCETDQECRIRLSSELTGNRQTECRPQ